MTDRHRLHRLALDGDHAAAAELVDVLRRAGDRLAIVDLLDELGRPWPLRDRLGKPLSHWFDPQPADTVVALTRALLDAVEPLHAAGRIQGFWSPDQILVRELGDDRFVVLDLGQRDLEAVDPEGEPAWLDARSPAQARGEPDTPADDLFAIGVLTYIVYTGRKPWPGDTEMARLFARITQPALPPMRHPEPNHPGLGDLLIELLDLDPDRRPATVGELRDRLDRAVLGDARARIAEIEFEMVTAAAGYGAPPTELMQTQIVDTPAEGDAPRPRQGLLQRLRGLFSRGGTDG